MVAIVHENEAITRNIPGPRTGQGKQGRHCSHGIQTSRRGIPRGDFFKTVEKTGAETRRRETPR